MSAKSSMLCHVSSNSSNSKKLFGRASETVQIGGWLLLPYFAGCAHRTFTFGRRTYELLKMFPRDLLSPKMKNKTPFLIIYKGRSSLALTSWYTPHLQTSNRSLQIVQTVRKIGDYRNSFRKKNVDSKNQPEATKCLLSRPSISLKETSPGHGTFSVSESGSSGRTTSKLVVLLWG